MVGRHATRQIGILILQPHDRRPRKDDLQIVERVIQLAKLLRPIRILKHLVDQQHAPAIGPERRSEVYQRALREVKVVQVDVKASLVVCSKTLTGVIEQECGLANATRPFDADQAIVPINLVHQPPAHRRMQVLHQILMCPIKRFHFSRFLRLPIP